MLQANHQSLLQDVIDQTWAIEERNAFLKALSDQMTTVVTHFQEIGDAALVALKEEESLNNYLLTYEWPNLAKSFLFLWRDILFQQQKAALLLKEGVIDAMATDELKKTSKVTLQMAFEEVFNFVAYRSQKIRETKNGVDNEIEAWQLQLNPYPTYREQFAELAKQGQYLEKQFDVAISTIVHFKQLRKLVKTTVEKCLADVENIQKESIRINAFIEENLLEKKEELPNFINEKIDEIHLVNHFDEFRDSLEKNVSTLSAGGQIPVHTQDGKIEYRDINWQRRIRQWMESEILPLLYDVWATTNNTYNGVKMSLVTIRNQANLMLNETKISNNASNESLNEPLERFTERAIAYEKRLTRLSKKVLKLLEQDFRFASIYNLEQEFLPVSLQSTVDQFKLGENEWLKAGNNWWNRQLQRLRQLSASVAEEESLSISEKIVRFVQSRTTTEAHQQYASIFLTEGYIGESFWNGREAELAHVEKIVAQWKQYFRGSIVLSGQRFSGKSLFGALVARRFFNNEFVRLLPNSVLNLEGRKLTTTYDLGAALDFLEKYSINKKRLVWIDDLELWNAPDCLLSKNIKALAEHLDNHARHNFFLVSMSNWLQARLQKTHQIDNIFQSEINLDKMSLAEVRQAIIVRHGATHKILVNEKGAEIDSNGLNKMIKRIYRASQGNVGEALMEWTSATYPFNDQKVVYRQHEVMSLPPFLKPDTAILLAAIMMEKRTNEYRLQKAFGPAFKERFGNILQRLMNIGFLKRYPDGWLEINEVVVNELGQILDEKSYLSFYK
ncbi:MAG: hypothetical protein AB8G15_11450 [Saprospiraceae bacterium]